MENTTAVTVTLNYQGIKHPVRAENGCGADILNKLENVVVMVSGKPLAPDTPLQGGEVVDVTQENGKGL